MYETEQRPDPDRLLEQIKQDESEASRGRFRIYLGACAGVGKTCTMLKAAHEANEDGQHVLAGVVETHGRQKTVDLLEGLLLLPKRSIDYRGQIVQEFDLDLALQQHPQVLLLDELAHSNAPGSRHAKRWQDVMELLDAGIDVWTTLNIQHLESLNTTVGTITGVRIHETIPDFILDKANELLLVDITPDELIRRLKNGQVYVSDQIESAVNGFFRKGNLIALREIALRKTADRVESEILDYRNTQTNSNLPTWNTAGSILLCVGVGDDSDHTVRVSAQLAQQFNVPFYACYVETPRLQRLPDTERNRVLSVLKLAQDLGAITQVLTGDSVIEAVARYARYRNCNYVVLGRPSIRLWSRRSVKSGLSKKLPEAHLIEVGVKGSSRALNTPIAVSTNTSVEHSPLLGARYLAASIIPGLTGLLATPLLKYFDLANIVMIFLASVVWVAYRYGRGPSIYAAVLNVAIFDFFFVVPRFSFAVSDVQYLLTFGVMLSVGLLIGHLTAGLRYQARVASTKQEHVQTLFELARELSSALQAPQVLEIAREALDSTWAGESLILTLDASDNLAMPATLPLDFDHSIADWVYRHGQAAGLSTSTLSASPWYYLPLQAPMRIRGILAIKPRYSKSLYIPEQKLHIETMARQVAIALERIHYVDVAQKALIQMESESLRGALLASISHDLRTPLTALTGMAETLRRSDPPLSPQQLDLSESIMQQARQLTHQVCNLLDMAKLQTGSLYLKLQWEYLEEIAATAIANLRLCYPHLEVALTVQRPSALVQVDALLMERAVFNLLENAVKYGKSPFGIQIQADNDWLCLQVIDCGGMDMAKTKQLDLFKPFERGVHESSVSGFGLGLAIVKAVVMAHGGYVSIGAISYLSCNSATCFTVKLPRGKPPDTPE